MTVIFRYKVLLLGGGAVGKTSLLHKFVDDTFKMDYSATLGAKFLSKKVKIDPTADNDEVAELSIWDIGGSSKFIDLRTTFYRGANGALLIYDLAREDTFEDLNNWYKEMTEVLTKEVPIVIIGNKLDLIKKKGGNKKAMDFARKKNSIYIETSAKTGENVEKAFLELTHRIGGKHIAKYIKKPSEGKKKSIDSVIVKSKIRNYIKSKGFNTSKNVLDGDILNKIVLKILDKSVNRAKANRRKTVQSKDL